MDFDIPAETQELLAQLDAFIESEIKPLEQQDDNIRFFDHRREYSRTNFEAGGVPTEDWEALLREMRRRADAAGWLRLALPVEFGGKGASNLTMAIIREHFASKGLGLHNDLQNESSIVGNFPTVLMMRDFGTPEQKEAWMPGFLDGTRRLAFGLTEPNHGSDATYMETTAVKDGDEWVINGMKRWNSGLHHATHDIIFARTSGENGAPKGISAFLVPTDSPGFKVEFFWWTFNMPTDHAEVSLTDVRVGSDALFGPLDRGLELAQHFVHENRIRQAASSLGAAQYCINEAVAYANSRITWGKKLSTNQGIQFPLVELHSEAAMLRQLIRYTAWMLDRKHHMEVTHLVAMCNYRANRLVCEAADRAMQTCGGVGYSRHMPFEHIYRHHRRYRITEGAEEIQMRKVAQNLFGFGAGEPERHAVSRDIPALVASLTIDERASLTTGATGWSTTAIPRVGLPEVFVTDGPAGARGPQMPGAGEMISSLNIPCGAALGATWNAELLEQIGEALGDQTRTKACRVLLAPTVNLHRAPLAGRNFESYSEDPLLTGKLAAAFIRGVQSHGVATTVKHFAGNEAEFERMTIDSVIDQRTLRELYLLPFELAVKEGGSLGIMTSYNRLNGTYNAENHWLLQTVLRDEWGFEGFVVTDWFAGGSTAGAAAAGLDLEMPAPARFYGRKLGQAVRDGEVPESQLDGAVQRMLTVFDRIGALDDEPREPIAIDRPEHRVLAHRAATESMVLLKNDGVLPFAAAGIRTLAVVGPNVERARIMGGGSAEVEPHYRITPLEALRTKLGDSVTIVHEQGCDIDKTVPLMSSSRLGDGFTIEIFKGGSCEGDVFVTTTRHNGSLIVRPGVDAEAPRGPMSFRATASFNPAESGPHILSMMELGSARFSVDGAVVFDGITNPTPRGEAFFGVARQELTAEMHLEAGRAYVLDVEFASIAPGWMQGVQLGCKPVPSPDLMDRAVAAAASADAVIVIVGTNNDWETEGHDRHSLDLPGTQAELIERVSLANPNTVIVVNAGAPITTAWAADAPAVLQAWFGGQEMANALVDILFGDTDPSGRLPNTFPERIEHTPSFGNFPGEHGQIRYGEGVLMGYRWYEARRLSVPFAFGHGLSYTTFDIGLPEHAATFDPTTGALTVTATVTNTGGRRGAEVVQCYVGAESPKVVRPPKELKAFAKVWLDPGETTAVTFTLDSRAFVYWDPGNAYKGQLVPDAVGVFGRTPDVDPGWRADAGTYQLHIGRSSDNIAHVTRVQLEVAGS